MMKKEFWQFWQGKYHPSRKMRVFQSGRGTPAKTAKTLLRFKMSRFWENADCWWEVIAPASSRASPFRAAGQHSTISAITCQSQFHP